MKLFKYLPILAVGLISGLVTAALLGDIYTNYIVLSSGNFFSCLRLTMNAAQPMIMAYVVILSILAIIRGLVCRQDFIRYFTK